MNSTDSNGRSILLSTRKYEVDHDDTFDISNDKHRFKCDCDNDSNHYRMKTSKKVECPQ